MFNSELTFNLERNHLAGRGGHAIVGDTEVSAHGVPRDVLQLQNGAVVPPLCRKRRASTLTPSSLPVSPSAQTPPQRRLPKSRLVTGPWQAPISRPGPRVVFEWPLGCPPRVKRHWRAETSLADRHSPERRQKQGAKWMASRRLRQIFE